MTDIELSKFPETAETLQISPTATLKAIFVCGIRRRQTTSTNLPFWRRVCPIKPITYLPRNMDSQEECKTRRLSLPIGSLTDGSTYQGQAMRTKLLRYLPSKPANRVLRHLHHSTHSLHTQYSVKKRGYLDIRDFEYPFVLLLTI